MVRLGTIQPRIPDYAGAFREIGPAAIKLGQTLATRPDLVGEEAAHNLLTLQDSLPPEKFERIYEEIDHSLNKPAAELFEHIDPEPVGAASIAQVHRARTTDGREVAVKVLRPGIRGGVGGRSRTPAPATRHRQSQTLDATRTRPTTGGGVCLRA